MSLEDRINTLTAVPITSQNQNEAHDLFLDVLAGLNDGSIRSAIKNDNGIWQVNHWVKKGILLGFKLGNLTDYSSTRLQFFDKDTYPLKPLTLNDNVRIVPGGSSIRTGCYVSRGVVCMPPMYINVGAYVDEGTLVDSHALIGSCAQVGKRVHVSAAVQIGGVLEPVGGSSSDRRRRCVHRWRVWYLRRVYFKEARRIGPRGYFDRCDQNIRYREGSPSCPH